MHLHGIVRRTAPAVAATAITILTTGCGSSTSTSSTTNDHPRPVSVSGRLRLLAPVSVAHGEVTSGTLAADPRTGRIYAAWSLDAGPSPSGYNDLGDPYVAWSDDGGRTFSKPVRVSRVHGENQSPLVLAVTPKGTVLVEWANNTADKRYAAVGGQFALRVARSTDGGRTWTVKNALPDGGAQSISRPGMFVAPDGNVWLQWLDGRPLDRKAGDPGYDVRLTQSRDDGRSFEVSYVAKGTACECCRPALAQNPKTGLLALVWRDLLQKPGTVGHGMEMDGMDPDGTPDPGRTYAKTDIRDIEVATSPDDGHNWGLGVQPQRENWHINGCPTIGPTLFYDQSGKRLNVNWFTGAPGLVGVWAASSTDNGKSWSTPVHLSTSVVGDGEDLAAVPGTDGTRWYAWATPKASQFASIGPDGTLAETSLLPTRAGASGRVAAPAIVATKTGALAMYLSGSKLAVSRVGS